jgi:hypothetical protein
MKKKRSERLVALMSKAKGHQYGIHFQTLHDSKTHPSTRAKLRRKRGGTRARREAQLNTLVHRLYYQLDDIKKGKRADS